MKAILTITLSLFFVVGYSQEVADEPDYSKILTTETEYNYITKGYKVMIESGLDAKSGYEWKDMFVYTSQNKAYQFDYKALLRTSGSKPELAGILVIAKSSGWGNTYYICIPNVTISPYMANYFTSIGAWDKTMLLEYFKSYSSLSTASVKYWIETYY